MESKKFLIAGGTGFIGRHLTNMLLKDGHYVTIITRSPAWYTEKQAKNRSYVGWDDNLATICSNHDVVINLAGESLFGQRWTDEVKKQIYNSRIDNTRKLVDVMSLADVKPELFISASAVGIYGNRGDDTLTEKEPPGNDFLADVCKDWESEANRALKDGIRVAIPRLGIVLEKEGGMLSKMVPAFRFFVGGPIGSGKQYIPWIHMRDLCNALLLPFRSADFSGIYNACSPSPETMDELAKTIGSVMNRPSFFKVPEPLIRLALGDAADPVTDSLRVIPARLLEAGFSFQYDDLKLALADIL